jgi:DNA-binding transcriptional ArsR family regulator
MIAAEALDRTCVALASPVRRRVVEKLRSGAKPLGALAEGENMSRPAVSQHVKVLLEAGLVSVRRKGRNQIYHLEPKALTALRAWLERQWEVVLGAFAEAAAKEHQRRKK